MKPELKEYLYSTLGDMQARREIVVNNAVNNVERRVGCINTAIYGLLMWEWLSEEGHLTDDSVLSLVDQVNEKFKLLQI